MVDVRYYCPHCGTVAVLDRDPYLADKSVTPYPLEGWVYVAPDEDYEGESVEGVRFVCGESDGCAWEHADTRTSGDTERAADGCGEPFYLNFVKYDAGEPVEGVQESEYVELAEGRTPTGPQGPSGPGFRR